MLTSARTALIQFGASVWPRMDRADYRDPRGPFKRSSTEVRNWFCERGLVGSVLNLFDSEDGLVEQLDRMEKFLADPQHKAIDTVVVHYVGHGTFPPERQAKDHVMLLRDTDYRHLDVTGLRVGQIAEAVRRVRADVSLYGLLDCCYAAAGVIQFQSDLRSRLERSLDNELPAGSSAVLCATDEDSAQPVDEGGPLTRFTHGLMTALQRGDPSGPEVLTLSQVWTLTRTVLVEEHGDMAAAPVCLSPRQTGVQQLQDVPFVPNLGHRGPSNRGHPTIKHNDSHAVERPHSDVVAPSAPPRVAPQRSSPTSTRIEMPSAVDLSGGPGRRGARARLGSKFGFDWNKWVRDIATARQCFSAQEVVVASLGSRSWSRIERLSTPYNRSQTLADAVAAARGRHLLLNVPAGWALDMVVALVLSTPLQEGLVAVPCTEAELANGKLERIDPATGAEDHEVGGSLLPVVITREPQRVYHLVTRFPQSVTLTTGNPSGTSGFEFDDWCIVALIADAVRHRLGPVILGELGDAGVDELVLDLIRSPADLRAVQAVARPIGHGSSVQDILGAVADRLATYHGIDLPRLAVTLATVRYPGSCEKLIRPLYGWQLPAVSRVGLPVIGALASLPFGLLPAASVAAVIATTSSVGRRTVFGQPPTRHRWASIPQYHPTRRGRARARVARVVRPVTTAAHRFLWRFPLVLAVAIVGIPALLTLPASMRSGSLVSAAILAAVAAGGTLVSLHLWSESLSTITIGWGIRKNTHASLLDAEKLGIIGGVPAPGELNLDQINRLCLEGRRRHLRWFSRRWAPAMAPATARDLTDDFVYVPKPRHSYRGNTHAPIELAEHRWWDIGGASDRQRQRLDEWETLFRRWRDKKG